ncbi:hypothetical protein PAERUG_P47_London_12_VIM_2_12_12_05141 [Pseudomonas aeruginosa]|nr:hypothetical protein PAERUG_P47_London_12_VIM_2_12_12_05141 [Pseudomonas aeruginosa]
MLVQRGDLGGGRLLGASLGPVLEGREGQRGIVALAGEAEARDQEHRSHRLAGLEEALELLAGGIGAHARSARRQLHVDHHVAEVFRRHEGFRQAQVEVAEHGHQAGVHQHEASGARHQLRVEQRIALGDAGEATVEGAEEAALLVVPFGNGLEQRGAQRRGEGQGEEAGEQDRDRQRHRELLVDHPHRTGHESQRQEHRREHQGDADDGAGHLLHRLDRGLGRGNPLLRHDPLDVLHHHDGVVHQDADRQDHAEHGHHVHREPQQVHHHQRTQQAHRHHDGRDQGVADVLQEQEHHQEHQDHRFDQGVDHLLDGHVDEARGVVGHAVLHVLGEERRQFGETLFHQGSGLDRVGPGRQLDSPAHGGRAVQSRGNVVALLAEFQARDIGEPDQRAVLVGAQHYLAELLRIVQGALHRQGRRQLLRGTARCAAEGAGRHLHVLPADGIAHVVDGEAEAHQLLRIDPDPHGRLGREELQLADARQAPQLVVDIARGVVAEGGGVAALSAFLVAERIDQQETGAGLLDLQALGQHRLRHARLGFLQAVLHVHLGQVRIGARLEGDDDLGGAVGVVGRLEVEQALGAVQRLLKHTGDGVHQHLRRGAGIGGGDGDLWRRDIGVLRYR